MQEMLGVQLCEQHFKDLCLRRCFHLGLTLLE